MKKKVIPLPVIPDEVENAWYEYGRIHIDHGLPHEETSLNLIRNWCESAGFRVNPGNTLTVPEFEGGFIQTAYFLRALSFMMGELNRSKMKSNSKPNP